MVDREIQSLSFLIVDDDAGCAAAVENILRALGASRIVQARSGTEAITTLTKTKRPFDCTLADLEMPHGNGLRLLKALRTGLIPSTRPDTCFIMMSDTAESDVVQTAADLDVSGYLVKPVVPERLRTAITRARQRYFPLKRDAYAAVPVPQSNQA
jgi:two-component system chemotaxis response regulator CheY